MNHKLIDLPLLVYFKDKFERKFERKFDKKLEDLNAEIDEKFGEVNANLDKKANSLSLGTQCTFSISGTTLTITSKK